IPIAVAKDAEALSDASKIILPGVGAFDQAMDLLGRSGMRAVLDHLVLEKQVPVLGICVGMQILGRSSAEGTAKGLGWIDGDVKAFKSLNLPLPHMGWNDVKAVKQTGLLRGFDGEPRFYFLHSYFMACDNAADVAAEAHYGIDFCCAVNDGNIYGVQFHPEK